jgi:2,4-dichlorophenol 6-monooxygenase
MPTLHTQVLIVGAGPTGLFASRLLAQAGIRNIVIERRNGLHDAPQAHAINSRTLEMYRRAGIDQDALAANATPYEDMRYMAWRETLAGFQMGRLDMFEQTGLAQKYMRATPTLTLSIPQHRLEPVLLGAVREYALASVRFGQQWESIVQDEMGVTSTVRDLASDSTYTIHSDYVLGADGAGSRVRAALGIAMEGDTGIAGFITLHVQANVRHLLRDTPGLIYWIINPDTPGMFIIHDAEDTLVFMVQNDPEHDHLADYTPEVCEAVLRRALGEDIPFTIKAVSGWTMTAQVAESYGNGRVYLLGDAAHRFPPTGGLGLNTGAQDAYNLCWKLAAVLHGRANTAILATYEAECRPIAQINRDRSYANFRNMDRVTEAMGLDSSKNVLISNIKHSRLGRALPAAAMNAIGSTVKGFVQSRIDALKGKNSAAAERRARVQAAIDQQVGQFNNIGLDLGMRYSSPIILGEGSAQSYTANPDDYEPSTLPGGRFPHVWLHIDGATLSSHDLLSYHEHTLIIGEEGDAWQVACAEVGLRCVTIGAGTSATPVDEQWAAVRGVAANGAILVRPDGFVAWRSHDLPAAHLSTVLQAVLMQAYAQPEAMMA